MYSASDLSRVSASALTYPVLPPSYEISHQPSELPRTDTSSQASSESVTSDSVDGVCLTFKVPFDNETYAVSRLTFAAASGFFSISSSTLYGALLSSSFSMLMLWLATPVVMPDAMYLEFLISADCAAASELIIAIAIIATIECLKFFINNDLLI